MNYFNKIVVIACCVMAFAIWTGDCQAAEPEFKYKLNFLPWSDHHGDHNATNESHDGIGISVTLPNRATYGLMHYTNSYGDPGWMVSMTGEFMEHCTVCPGAGLGFAPEYAEADQSTIIGWASLRYKWVTVLTVPTEVTALVLSIPLN